MNKNVEILIRDCNGKRAKLICANRSQFINWTEREMLDDDEILLVTKEDMCLFSGLQTRDITTIETIANLFDDIGECDDDNFMVEGEGADDEITLCVLRSDEECHMTFSTRDKLLQWADNKMEGDDVILSIMQGDICIYDGMEDDVQLFCDDITGFFA